MKKNILFLILSFIFCSHFSSAQRGKTETLFISVEYNEDGSATIKWPENKKTDDNYHIYENKSSINSADFKYKTYVNSIQTGWTDKEYKTGTTKEYQIFRFASDNKRISDDLIIVGKDIETPNKKGGILVLLDNTYENDLSNDMKILKSDLERDGYTATIISVDREMPTTEVKNIIKDINNSSTTKLTTLYLIGHIPVPYSGHFSTTGAAYPPDGHTEGSGNHTGAWPADLYYGDLDGIWTDETVTYEQSALERNNNRPGDGKFDQTILPSEVELEVGRVDFYNMPAFEKTELELLKDYLNRAHLWKIGQLPTVDRGLIDDNFAGHIISNSAYKTVNSILGQDSLFDQRDYMTELVKEDYLFSFGDGGGSYTTCSGIGTTEDFAANNIHTIFTGLAGSFFGDWDTHNNFLRAAIASGALVSFWSGIPNWYLHPMAVGNTIGYCARYSQNSTISSFNYSERKIHVALLGDPTLTLRPIVPAKDITATETMEGIVLDWTESIGDIDGYNIYRIDEEANTSTKVNSEIITQNTYIDVAAPTGKFAYQLRTVKHDNLANNSYYTMGHSSTSNTVNFISSVEFSLDDGFNIAPNPSNGLFRLQLPKEAKAIKNIIIQDMTGRTVFELNGNWTNENTFNAALTNGTYMLIAKTDKGTYIEKIQIIR